MDDRPINTSIYSGFSMAMLYNEIVHELNGENFEFSTRVGFNIMENGA